MNIKKACKTLGVSRAGYYKYLNHKPSKRDLENESLKEAIKEVFDESKGRYGSIRIGTVLEQRGIHINRNQISRLMREMNLCPKGTRYNYKKYNQKNRGEKRPNLLNQMFVTDTKSRIFMLSISAFILLLQSF